MDKKTVVLTLLVLLAVVGMVFANIKYMGQEEKLVNLQKSIDELRKNMSEPVKETKEVVTNNVLLKEIPQNVQSLSLRVEKLESDQHETKQKIAEVRELPVKPADSVAAEPAKSPDIDDAKLTEAIKKEVTKVLDERRRESDPKVAGVKLIESGIGPLTDYQKEQIAPLMVDYAQKTRDIWWSNPRDENGKQLTYEEQVRRSDEVRAVIYENVKKSLTADQAMKFDGWIRERKAKLEKGERLEGQGPFQWF